MPQVDPNLCSAAFIIKCTITGKEAIGSVVKRCDNANNYRAEALGAMCGLLVLHAASRRTFRYGECHAYCDNKGVVGHAAKPHVPFADKQVQVFLAIKKLIQNLPVTVNEWTISFLTLPPVTPLGC